MLRASARRKEGLFLAEGLNAVEAAAGCAGIVDVFVDPASDLALPESLAVPPLKVSTAVMKALTDSASPQGVAAIVQTPDTSLARLPERASLVLVLAEVRDPGNAGTLIRSALGAGADAVVFTSGSVDPFGPKTVRSAAGALFAIPIVQADLGEVTTMLKGRGFSLLGTEAEAHAVHDVALTGPVALVLGNEAWGLPPAAKSLLDGLVGIPMPGPAESLNVAVAGSILLFEAARQRASTR